MKAIINATLVMRDHLIPEAALLIDGGKIAGFGEMHTTPIPEGCEIIDAGGLFVGPGLIDIHTHASDRVFFVDDPVAAAAHHLRHGTTSVLPALYFSMDVDGWLNGIAAIRGAMSDPACPNIAGLYMEGPYLNP